MTTKTEISSNTEIEQSTLFTRLKSKIQNQKSKIPWVILGHFLLTCLYTYPLVFNFGSKLPGILVEDRDQNLWNLWWVRDSLLHLRNPFRTEYIYQPEQISLYFHTLNPLNGIITLPVQLLFGLTAAYNFVVFFSFVMAGLGSWLLLKYLCGNGWAAFAASLVFVYSPFHIFTLIGLMQLISLEWIPFYLLFLLRAVREPRHRLRHSAIAAAFLVCIALIDWYYTLFTLGLTALYIGWVGLGWLIGKWRKRPTGEGDERDSLWPVGLTLVLFGLVISPVLLPMLRELGSTTYYLPDPADIIHYAPDWLAFWLPPVNSSVFGGISRGFLMTHSSNVLSAQVYLGYVALGLAGLGLATYRQSRFWGLAGLVFWVLSLGPVLKLDNQETGLPLPYRLIQDWPVIKITRSPDRFIVITTLALAVCVAYGLAWLNQKLAGRLKGRDWLPAVAAMLLISAEFLQIPYPLSDYSQSPYFTQLSQDKSDYAVLNLPAQNADWPGAAYMAEQTVHHKRIFDGYISREYDHPFERRSPGFQELTGLKFNHDIILPATGQNDSKAVWYNAFSYYRVRYIILHLPQTPKQRAHSQLEAERAAIQQVAPGQPVYHDDLIEVYPVPAPATPRPFAEIGNGWADPEPDSADPATLYHRWASDTANVDLLWQGPGTTSSKVSFKTGVLSGQRAASINLDGQVVWQGQLNTAQEITLDLTLTPGRHHLNFGVEGPAVSPQSLGMGNDPRKLLFYLTQLRVN